MEHQIRIAIDKPVIWEAIRDVIRDDRDKISKHYTT